MARSGMLDLIQQLRLMTDTAAASDSVNGVDYWTDDQLQNVLDRHRYDRKRVLLRPEPTYTLLNAIEYKDFYFPVSLGKWVERADSAGAFSVIDNVGVPRTIGAMDNQYQVDYYLGKITFPNDQKGYSFYLDCRVYDLNKAAAEIWMNKASLRASLIDWKTDNHSLFEDQEYRHCMEMYKFYLMTSVGSPSGGMRSAQMVRVDLRSNVRDIKW